MVSSNSSSSQGSLIAPIFPPGSKYPFYSVQVSSNSAFDHGSFPELVVFSRPLVYTSLSPHPHPPWVPHAPHPGPSLHVAHGELLLEGRRQLHCTSAHLHLLISAASMSWQGPFKALVHFLMISLGKICHWSSYFTGAWLSVMLSNRVNERASGSLSSLPAQQQVTRDNGHEDQVRFSVSFYFSGFQLVCRGTLVCHKNC